MSNSNGENSVKVKIRLKKTKFDKIKLQKT
nr:MAG TPA: hypothetical protein [Caudoviricetes sp.]